MKVHLCIILASLYLSWEYPIHLLSISVAFIWYVVGIKGRNSLSPLSLPNQFQWHARNSIGIVKTVNMPTAHNRCRRSAI